VLRRFSGDLLLGALTDAGVPAEVLPNAVTTPGIRRCEEERSVLEREFLTVETRDGTVRVKVVSAAREILKVMPEFEDCRRAALQHEVPLWGAMEAALADQADMGKAKP
jgi:pyridinium-3,5-bisthiocarboxylic acid mononucleotide nickel chelatase